jgi:hypothetical protein
MGRTGAQHGILVRPNHAAQRRSVADEWVTQLLSEGDAKVSKKYSEMKLQMKREAMEGRSNSSF